MISTRSNRSKQMVVHFIKNISKADIPENIPQVEVELRKWINETKDLNFWKQCKRLLFNRIELFEQHGDNVIKNELTCRAEFTKYIGCYAS